MPQGKKSWLRENLYTKMNIRSLLLHYLWPFFFSMNYQFCVGLGEMNAMLENSNQCNTHNDYSLINMHTQYYSNNNTYHVRLPYSHFFLMIFFSHFKTSTTLIFAPTPTMLNKTLEMRWQNPHFFDIRRICGIQISNNTWDSFVHVWIMFLFSLVFLPLSLYRICSSNRNRKHGCWPKINRNLDKKFRQKKVSNNITHSLCWSPWASDMIFVDVRCFYLRSLSWT